MEVRYATSKLEKRCTSDAEMRKQYSAGVAKSLKLRLVQLRTASNVQELFAESGKWHPLTGTYKGYVAENLSANWRIIFRGVTAGESELNWSHVEVVSIEEITDYH